MCRYNSVKEYRTLHVHYMFRIWKDSGQTLSVDANTIQRCNNKPSIFCGAIVMKRNAYPSKGMSASMPYSQ
jgi:hypothetical protein